MTRVPLPNTAPRRIAQQETPLPCQPEDKIRATAVVRRQGSAADREAALDAATAVPLGKRRYLSLEELERLWGASPEDLDAVCRFGESFGLRVVYTSALRRVVVFEGRVCDFEKALSVQLVETKNPGMGTYRTYTAPLSVPEHVVNLVDYVLGLDNIPHARPQLVAPAPTDTTMHARELLDAYDFPSGLAGKGQRIAVVGLGGGYERADLDAYFAQIDQPMPPVYVEKVGWATGIPATPAQVKKYWEAMKTIEWDPCKGGPRPSPTGDAEVDALVTWTIESTMDLELAGTAAPEADLSFFVANNNDQGHFHAFTRAMVSTEARPDVVSCSFGSVERRHAPYFMDCMNECHQVAALLGITVVFSTGDFGDGSMCRDPSKAPLVVEFPASSPHVLACGGTSLDPATGTETVWSQKLAGVPVSSSGGFSRTFDLPDWQRAAGIRPADFVEAERGGGGRAIPDVASKANFDTPFSILVGGMEIPMGGTSAATPIWAGLIARLNEGLGRNCGLLGPALYEPGVRAALRAITEGSIGFYEAGDGWDPCTGWGTPRGTALLEALRKLD